MHGDFEQVVNSVEKSKMSIAKIGKYSTPKRVRIRPKNSAAVPF